MRSLSLLLSYYRWREYRDCEAAATKGDRQYYCTMTTTGSNDNTDDDDDDDGNSNSRSIELLQDNKEALLSASDNKSSIHIKFKTKEEEEDDDDEPQQQQQQQQQGRISSSGLRIVSLLPSITEILAAIGVGDDIVGITHECDYPECVVGRVVDVDDDNENNTNSNNKNTNGAKKSGVVPVAKVVVTTSAINPRTLTQSEIHAAVVGSLAQGHSLYGLNHDALRSVQPDIIFTQSLCDVCAVSYPVVLETCAKILAGPVDAPAVVLPTTTTTTTCSRGGGGGSNSSNTGDIEQAVAGDDDGRSPAADDGIVVSNIKNNKEPPPPPLVISMEPNNLKDVLTTFHVAARALGRCEIVQRADDVVRELERGFESIRQAVAAAAHHDTVVGTQSKKKRKPTVAFMEWHCPIFSGGHWIPDMIQIAGGDYQMCQSGDRSAAWTDKDFAKLDPDIILIGPCGFSLRRAVQDTLALYQDDTTTTSSRGRWWKQLRAVQTNRVYALDGNSYYARPGPRLLQGCGIMAKCIHDDNDSASFMLSPELAPSSGYCRITPDMWCTAKQEQGVEPS
jgi:ABC-type Fe3+-hydroxamate transport system substrate-binding protein